MSTPIEERHRAQARALLTELGVHACAWQVEKVAAALAAAEAPHADTSRLCPRCKGTGRVTRLAPHEPHYHDMERLCSCGANQACRICGFGHGSYPCACTPLKDVATGGEVTK